jgi:hypothetical protein
MDRVVVGINNALRVEHIYIYVFFPLRRSR